MIELDRSRVEMPECLNLEDPNSPASKETDKMIAHVLDPIANPKPTIGVYRRDEVKLALVELSHAKCAYCEKALHDASRDIEHFRPKGRVDPGDGAVRIKPGYYWLAASWTNLLLSCSECNQLSRKLEQAEDGGFSFTEEATGKLDLFPLRDEIQRVRTHTQDLAQEEPFRLLLNPCRDAPRKHIRFDTEGNAIPRRIQGRVSDMATTSISVFDLNRQGLRLARKKIFMDIVKCWDTIEMASLAIDPSRSSHKTVIRGVLRKHGRELMTYEDRRQPFSSMSMSLVKPFLVRLSEVKAQFETVFGEPVDPPS